MPAKIIIEKTPAKDRLKATNLFFAALKKNALTLSVIMSVLATITFIVVVTWCAFTIQTQNKLIEEQNAKLDMNEAYMSIISSDLKVLKSKH